MPATQDAGSATSLLLTHAIALHEQAAARLRAKQNNWTEAAFNIAVRREVIRKVYRKLETTGNGSPAALGLVYTTLLDRTIRLSRRGLAIDRNSDHRKAHGVYYTPAIIVQHLVKSAIDRVLNDRNPTGKPSAITLLDPACGAGWFLIEAMRYVRDQVNAQDNPVKLHLVGADIDPVAVEVARLSLKLAEEKEDRLGGSLALPVQSTFITGNSLLGPDAASDGIDWHRAFPAIMNAGGFDIVIGNPPYVSYSGRQAEPLAQEQRQHIEKHFTTTGWLTAHGLFIERAAGDLSKRITAMVVPDQVGHLSGYQAVRDLLARHSTLAEVRYWGEGQFEQAVTPVLTFVADRQHRGMATIIDANGHAAALNLCAGGTWQSCQSDDLLAKLASQSRFLITEVADPGVHTGNCAAKLILSQADAAGEYAAVLEGRQISRYACEKPRRVLRLDYTPKPGEYFRISAPHRYTDAPFLIRQTAAFPIVGPRLHADYFRNSLLALYPPTDGTDIRYLVGLLNSRLIRHVYRRLVAESKQKAFPQVKVRSLRMLPVRKIDWDDAKESERHDRIVALVQRMLDLQGTRGDLSLLASVDRELDCEVFELYGLNETEKDAVNDGAPSR
ncbi:MAG: TaqI-like C-terminal specificity domain-containing protein [Phycisphaeraceae bacterium]